MLTSAIYFHDLIYLCKFIGKDWKYAYQTDHRGEEKGTEIPGERWRSRGSLPYLSCFNYYKNGTVFLMYLRICYKKKVNDHPKARKSLNRV